MGRKKLTNERFQIRCHPNVIKGVRIYAKKQSEFYLEMQRQIDEAKTESEKLTKNTEG